MGWHNSPKRYGLTAQLFHWVTLLLVVALFALASYFEEMPAGPEKGVVIGWHKSIGITVMLLTLLRLGWRLLDTAPPPVFAPAQWQQRLTLWTHRGLYLLLIVLPFSGYLMSLAAGRPVVLFNQIALPVLLGENKPLAEQLKELHEILATLVFLLVALHSAAALWHQFFLRDHLLSRMWPGGDDQV